jgi:transcriptional regulator
MTLYNPEHFRIDDAAAQLAFIEQHAFGTLVSTTAAGDLHVSHIPFLPRRQPDGKLHLLGHVSRNNPQGQALADAARILAIFEGPHAYVSPGWYAQHPSVPTWNYAVVHAHGRARMLDVAELHELVMELSNKYEARREKPWKASELPSAYMEGMLQGIVGFEIAVVRLEAKFKLSQNRPAEVPRVIVALQSAGETGVAELMRRHALPGG